MSNTYIWRIIPTSLPTVVRNCSKCGNHCEFESSQNFRVNANQNHIDVWLIYQCKKCKSTWNMDILSRVNSNSISKELYHKFLSNDRKLAAQYAFDLSAHSRNKSVLKYDSVTYDVVDDDQLPSMKESFQLKIVCEYPFDVRLDKILSQKLNLTREAIKKDFRIGRITGIESKVTEKFRIKNEILLEFNCPDYL